MLFEPFPEGLYFDEFCALTEKVTSELFLAVYDCIHQCVPCVKNFLTLRTNFKAFVNTQEENGIPRADYQYLTLAPPISDKMVQRMSVLPVKHEAGLKNSVTASKGEEKAPITEEDKPDAEQPALKKESPRVPAGTEPTLATL